MRLFVKFYAVFVVCFSLLLFVKFLVDWICSLGGFVFG
jgi:hypothetical protein